MRPLGAKTARSRTSLSSIQHVLKLLPVVFVTGVLVGIYSLPADVRRSLAFEYAAPTLLTAYTANFVHFSPTHLVGNLLVFVLASGAIVLLFGHSRSRWVFYGFLLTLLTVFPILLSMLNLAIPRNGITFGFSGLNMALVGFLPVAIVRHTESRLREPVDTTFLLATFFLSVSYVAVVAAPRTELSLTIVGVTILLGVGFAGCFSVWGLRSWTQSTMDGLGSEIDARVVLGIAAWIGLLSLGFPDAATGDGSVVNVYVHFLGYALGFMSAYLAHEWRLLGDRPAYAPQSGPSDG